eukprot:1914704-Pyramimonas_sp.AAC.1
MCSRASNSCNLFRASQRVRAGALGFTTPRVLPPCVPEDTCRSTTQRSTTHPPSSPSPVRPKGCVPKHDPREQHASTPSS